MNRLQRDAVVHPTVLVCQGTSCTKRRRKYAALVDELADAVSVEPVCCQKICKGPVAATLVKGRLEWFKRVDSKKSRKGLRRLAVGGRMKRALRKRLVKKRSGRLRRLT